MPNQGAIMGSGNHSQYMMTVLTGPHAGAEINLDTSRQRIGSQKSNDIRLSGTADEALRFRLGSGKIALRPGDGVVVAARGKEPFESGKTSTISLPAHVTLDDKTSLYFCELAVESRARSPLLSLAVVAALGLFVAVKPNATGLAEASVLANSPIEFVEPLVHTVAAPPARPTVQEAEKPAEEMPVQLAQAETTEPKTCTQCETVAAAALETFMTDQGLSGFTILPETGVIRVFTSGMAVGDERWKAARAKYDRLWSSTVPLLLQKARPIPKAPFAIASVWLGHEPELETRDGVTYRIGDTTPDGWRITDIKSGQVDVAMGEDRVRIEF